MTQAAANRNTPQLAGLGQWPAALTIKDNEILFAGVMLAVDATPEVVEASDTAALKVIGRNPKYVDNTDDGKTVVPELGIFKYANDGDNPVVEGDLVGYVHDDQTVCASAGSTNKITAGLVVRVESDGVWMCQTLEGLRAAIALHDLSVESATAHIANTAAAAGACAGSATPSATNVDSAIATAVAPLVTTINAILVALETQLIVKSS